MRPGALARKILGDRWFPVVGRCYRAFFVDLEKVADCLPALPPGTNLLDVGGGDGELINILVRRHPGVRVTMIDLGARIGVSLAVDVQPHVTLLPGTSIRDYAASDRTRPDLVLISDVVHHVPPGVRAQFFADLRDLLAGGRAPIVIKDVEPGTFVATAAHLADKYVSGDRTVSPLGKQEMKRLVGAAFPDRVCRETDLITRDPPNYCLIVSARPGPGSPPSTAPRAGAQGSRGTAGCPDRAATPPSALRRR